MKCLWIPQAISILLLLVALNPENPYEYYILLRFICCACFAFLAFRFYETARIGWVWTFAVIAIIYNPFIRVHLTREIWTVVNIFTIIIAIASILIQKRERNDMFSKIKQFFIGKPEKKDDFKLGEMVYLMDYRVHYGPILKADPTPKQIAELYLFRGWTVQFFYRIFSTNPEMSEKILAECMYLYQFFGHVLVNGMHNISIERELNSDIGTLIDNRWQNYDSIFIKNRSKEGFPTSALIGDLTTRMSVLNTEISMNLSVEFMKHMQTIKSLAIANGLMR